MQKIQLIGWFCCGFGLFKSIHHLLKVNPKLVGLAVGSQLIVVVVIIAALILPDIYKTIMVEIFKVNPSLIDLYAITALIAVLLGVTCGWLG